MDMSTVGIILMLGATLAAIVSVCASGPLGDEQSSKLCAVAALVFSWGLMMNFGSQLVEHREGIARLEERLPAATCDLLHAGASEPTDD